MMRLKWTRQYSGTPAEDVAEGRDGQDTAAALSEPG